MASRLNNAEEHEHRPSLSGTPSAWKALIILAVVMMGFLFFDSIICGVLRVGFAGVAWSKKAELSIEHLTLRQNGMLQARGLVLSFGSWQHRSSLKIDWVEVQLPTLGTVIGFLQNKQPHLVREISLGKTKLVIDRRIDAPGDGALSAASQAVEKTSTHYSIPWIKLLPDAAAVGPLDLVAVGNNARIAVSNLYLSLPNRWTGRIAYSEAVLDIGSTHHVFTTASAPASWNGATLQLGKLSLTKELQLEELTLTPQRDLMEFGLRGAIGNGLLRGDGSFGAVENQSLLTTTMVGENLKMEAISMLMKQGEQRAIGTIRQARITFRGNPDRPLEADSSLRLIADDFRWEGRGWDSLRLSATLTGRVCRLSELQLRQKGNEVEAQGESKLPEDWHGALKAPFTASFHADLDDAGALAALAGTDFAQLSGSLELEGTIKGAENKAEGYCNLISTGMKIRNLPLDWLKGCLLFDGEQTRLSNLEAWSGKDRIVIAGVVENNRPHTYAATAQFGVGNLTKSLALLGISTASQIGGGAAQGTWTGDGSIKGHSGTFQAKLNDWISPWTKAGMSGSFEGSYSPGHLYCSKVEFEAEDLRLGLQLSASPTRLEAKSILATRKGKSDPLVRGEVSLPVNAPALWQSGDLVSNLGMKDPLDLLLELRGINVEELANLLGQKTSFGGTLEGNLSASGTPEIPEIHTKLKIAKLTLPDAATTIGVSLKMDSGAGRATCQLIQEPAKTSPLTLQGEIPLRLVTDQGKLHIADPTGPVHAVATMHTIPTSGWLSLWSGFPLVLRDGTANGSLTIGGTLSSPSVEGNLLLAAREAVLPGLFELSNLRLPIACSLTKATATGGTALFGTNLVALSGLLDWSTNSVEGRLAFTGKDLSFPQFAGLESRGDAELLLTMQGTNIPTLNGNLLIKQIAGTFLPVATPFFTPPGIVLNNAISMIPIVDSTNAVQLNLQAKTEGTLPLGGGTGADPAQLQAELQFLGGITAIRWSGNILVKNTALELPAGKFLIPEATLQSTRGEENFSFTAYGMTHLGFCMLQQNGSTQEAWIELLAPVSVDTTADMVLALATPEKSRTSGTLLLNQMSAWIRQNALFPLPSQGSISRRSGSPAAAALGFYGRPWSLSFQQPSPKN